MGGYRDCDDHEQQHDERPRYSEGNGQAYAGYDRGNGHDLRPRAQPPSLAVALQVLAEHRILDEPSQGPGRTPGKTTGRKKEEGVVGMSGRTIPTAPSPTQSAPANVHVLRPSSPFLAGGMSSPFEPIGVKHFVK